MDVIYLLILVPARKFSPVCSNGHARIQAFGQWTPPSFVHRAPRNVLWSCLQRKFNFGSFDSWFSSSHPQKVFKFRACLHCLWWSKHSRSSRRRAGFRFKSLSFPMSFCTQFHLFNHMSTHFVRLRWPSLFLLSELCRVPIQSKLGSSPALAMQWVCELLWAFNVQTCQVSTSLWCCRNSSRPHAMLSSVVLCVHGHWHFLDALLHQIVDSSPFFCEGIHKLWSAFHKTSCVVSDH